MGHSPETMPAQEQERLERLSSDFRGIFDSLSVDSEAVDALFKKIAESYQAEERAYHTLEHIDHLLSFLKAHRENIKDWRGVQLAAWFHDAVYNTKAGDNEEKSAQLANYELKQLGVSDKIIAHVAQLVRATVGHQVIAGDEDSAIFLDGDLAILGTKDDVYDKYAAQIRREYSWVLDEQYKEGRKRILEGLVSRPRIYCTEAAHSELDAQARKNIKREIQRLG